MLQFLLVEHALLGLNAGPFDGKTVGIQSGICHEANILLIAVVVIHCIQRRLSKAGGFHVFQCPVVAVNVVAFHLMGSRCSTDIEFL